MKWILPLLFMLLGLTSFSRNFHVGAGGNNSASGLTIALRWLDISKVNSFTFTSGDTISFAGGETFRGAITLNQNGLTVTSYGTGKALLSGLTPLTGWVNIGGNIWQMTPSPRVKKNCNILTTNGIPQEVGRFPNTGSYLVYQSANTTTLTSTALTGNPNYTGAELVFKNNSYSATKAAITGQSANVLTYGFTQGLDAGRHTGSQPVMVANYGFFLQRFATSLDKQWEWFYDSVANKMNIFSTGNPSTVTIKASYVDTILTLGNHTGMVVKNISFEGAGMYAIESFQGANLIVQNCNFDNNTRAIYCWGLLNGFFDNDTMIHSLSNAILVDGFGNRPSKQLTMQNCWVDSSGLLIGMGLYWSDNNLKAVVLKTDTTVASNYLKIIGNNVHNTGFMGIQFQGSGVTVRKNIVSNYVSKLQDGGAIYTFTNNQSLNNLNYRNRLVDSNFMYNAIGAPWGVGNDVSIDVAAYYLDDQATVITGLHNTIYNIPGNAIQMNSPHDNIFSDNTVYNCQYANTLNHAFANATMFNNRVTRNVLYQKVNTQFMFFSTDNNLSTPTPQTATQRMQNIAVVDSNWISNTKTLGFRYWYSANGSGFTIRPDSNLTSWKNTYLHEVHCVLPPIPLTNTNTNLYTNPSDNLLTINFPGLRKIDPKGIIYDHQATIGRWSSLVLIDDGNAPQAGNIPPIARAGTDQVITLPTSTATLNGTASSDVDGSIVAYLWTKISGPSGGTIVQPVNAITNITGLTQGTYNYRLKVTDNIGDTSIDFIQIQVNAAPIPPVANAGADQVLQLPNNSTTVSGDASTDADGIILTYLWTKISGPTGGNITSPNSSITLITNFTAGVYVYSLTVTDNSGLSNTDFMQITVNAVVPPDNIPPVSDAGPDQVRALPTNTVTLNGTASFDVDGTIVAYLWTKISGPTGGTIATPTSAITNVTGLTQGTYNYKLRVTDNIGDTSIDFMQIQVNPAPIAPVANAGADQTLQLPQSGTTVSGSGSFDIDGTIVSYLWTKISGPAGGNITSPNAIVTTIANMGAGVYTFSLTVVDNSSLSNTDFIQITVLPVVPPVNEPPVSDAGTNQTVTLPTSTATLNGSGSTDPDGTIVSYLWRKISGPTGGTITTPTNAITGVTGLIAGIYIYQLRVIDNNGDSSVDAMSITVNAQNVPPTVNAGADQSVQLPTNSTTLTGTATDVDGTISSVLWTKISGPTGGTITSNTSLSTTITGLTAGQYIYNLRATDNVGDTSVDAVQITVLPVIPPVNIPPVSNAGPDQTKTLPVSTATLDGTGSTDADGTIVGYLWRKISGPTGGAITSSTSATTGVTGLIAGTYIYQLRVTDNSGDTSIDAMSIQVNAANVPPVVNAGIDQTIALPTNSTTVTGTASDIDGTVTGTLWTKISGPIGGTITSPTNLSTTITSLGAGQYIFNLRATDNAGDTSVDAIQITVNPAPPLLPPVADAGIGQTLTLPTNSTTLHGTATDVDGSIVSYGWVQLTGPNSATGMPSSSQNQAIGGMIAGTYSFQLTATDNDALTGKDTVIIIVQAAPSFLPLASAGGDFNTFNTTITLNGSGSDQGGTITNYSWAITSEPSGSSAVITSPTSATTTVTGLMIGIYTFELTVTDNDGNTATDSATVTVETASGVLLRFYKILTN